MNVKFEQQFFVSNRNKLRNLFVGTAPIVLTANGLLQRNADNTYLFRQDSSFWYFTGIEIPGAILVIEKDREYLIIPKKSDFSIIAEGEADLENVRRVSGVETIYDEEIGWKQLNSKIKKVKHVATIVPAEEYIKTMGLYTNPTKRLLSIRLKDTNPQIIFLDIRQHISKLRCIKQSPEIRAIREAITITNKTISNIYKNITNFKYEYEIEAVVLSEFKKQNADLAYPPIIASGLNACVLHYSKNDTKLEPKDLILIDVGASVSNYASDITRTFSLKHNPNNRQLAVLKSVLDVQKFAQNLMKPGLDAKKYELEVERFMGEQLRELGLIRTITHDLVRKYYPHSTSHFLGLDPHDIGDYKSPFEEDMVLTIEPGIYIPEEGIGVRIEDDYLLTKDGCLNLSANLPTYVK
ncbi:MAG TPA: Xaa-Pro aminopeptidase [Candidatus Saccharimonadia bacterium]|nr:Xaa-Pro aminopeptidase [Candidatus Saccharimonadia bacterium]